MEEWGVSAGDPHDSVCQDQELTSAGMLGRGKARDSASKQAALEKGPAESGVGRVNGPGCHVRGVGGI